MAEKYLIVEGYYDFLFYTSLFKELSLRGIDIIQPKDFSPSFNGKGNAVNMLNDLIWQLYDGRAKRIGIIIDADFDYISNQGFHNTFHQVCEKVKDHGYEPFTQPCNYHKGIILKSSKGLPEVAVWIMPDNSHVGYLEFLLLDSINSERVQCLKEAENICKNLENFKFPEHHKRKAILAIFMAMQENPGRNITHLIEKKYLDFEKATMKNLITFVKTYYTK